MIKKIIISIIALLVMTITILLYLGNITPPKVQSQPLNVEQIKSQSKYFHKKKFGIHNIFLEGSDFERGQQFGYWTKSLLQRQEQRLLRKFDEIFPSKITQYSIAFFSKAWFQGLDNYIKTNWQKEMYGVSLFAPKEKLFFSDSFTRQIAFHGIHDMGQMMIDQGMVLGACSQMAVPLKSGWLLGRIFDFEADRVFDEDKVIKWVFPLNGYPFVSVIFSGMVGVITGINNQGVYVAINSAGSDDFKRLGTPTTLIALDAVQNASSAKEAVNIIKNSDSLITEIFVVADQGSKIFIVEKTPEKVRIITRTKMTAVTNHLQHADFRLDETNQNRMKSNTTLERFKLIEEKLPFVADKLSMLKALRTKFNQNGASVIGHRNSIDALIASHSVIYDSQKQQLYVSKGPSLKGQFIGFDLQKSFAQREPVVISSLPKDPELSNLDYYQMKKQLKQLKEIRQLAQDKLCTKAETTMKNINQSLFTNHYSYFWSLAELAQCNKDKTTALRQFKKAKNLAPAYRHERDHIDAQIETLNNI